MREVAVAIVLAGACVALGLWSVGLQLARLNDFLKAEELEEEAL